MVNVNPDNGNNRQQQWHLTREKILMFFGLALIAFEAINSEIRGGAFHYEFLVCGLALCGISIAGWGNKKVD
jgi:hypothetical protein